MVGYITVLSHPRQSHTTSEENIVKKRVIWTALIAVLIFIATLFVATPADAAAAPSVQSCASQVIRPNGHNDVSCVRVLQNALGVRNTGNYAEQTQAAVRAFQQRHGLTPDMIVGRDTWRALSAGSAAPSNASASSTIPAACRPYIKANTRMACVNMTAGTVTLFVNGQVITTEQARFGLPGYETPTGAFRIYLKSANYFSRTYQVDMPYTLMFRNGVALHYSVNYANGVGTRIVNGIRVGSHGCVNLKSLNGAKTLFANLRVGDAVVVTR